MNARSVMVGTGEERWAYLWKPHAAYRDVRIDKDRFADLPDSSAPLPGLPKATVRDNDDLLGLAS